uniref:elongation of very long chain fatty acids protein F-like isoform X2 n=1 Tax=Vespula vulgaris TaxID=7454 RepID=UPI00223B5FAF|nr:elongation of very long chain fatty acids protein F-like isoform X2 [Vespula vulgaris]
MDPRVKDWVLSNPSVVISILFSYLYFVLVCGPRFMKNRQPYSLKTFIRCYDIFQMIGLPRCQYFANLSFIVQILLIWRCYVAAGERT